MVSDHEISAGYEKLCRDAVPTVVDYVRDVRRAMGDAWCDANPQAMALLVQAAAIDFHGATLGKEIGKLTKAVEALDLGE